MCTGSSLASQKVLFPNLLNKRAFAKELLFAISSCLLQIIDYSTGTEVEGQQHQPRCLQPGQFVSALFL
jgi:hypothetical protein